MNLKSKGAKSPQALKLTPIFSRNGFWFSFYRISSPVDQMFKQFIPLGTSFLRSMSYTPGNHLLLFSLYQIFKLPFPLKFSTDLFVFCTLVINNEPWLERQNPVPMYTGLLMLITDNFPSKRHNKCPVIPVFSPDLDVFPSLEIS